MKFDRYLLLALLITLIGGIPFLFFTPGDNLDYDYFLSFHEAVRKTIIEYGEFPFWHPWHFGGTPLFANPQFTVIGIETLFVLLFGTWYGVPLAMLCYLLIGTYGMWLLLEKIKVKFIRAWGAVLFGLSGGLILHISGGHNVMSVVSFLPLLLYFLFRAPYKLSGAIGLGILGGMVLNHSLHYVSLISITLLLLLFIPMWYKNRANKIFYFNFAIAACLIIFVGGYRTIITLNLIHEFPRKMDILAAIAPWQYLVALVFPGQTPIYPIPMVLTGYWKWIELGSYVGIVGVGGFIYSLRYGWRWFHTLFLLCAVLALNSSSMWLPGYWLRQTPIFESIFAITRWRLAGVCFLAFGATWGYYRWYLASKKMRRVIPVLLAISALFLIYNSWVTWNSCDYLTEAASLATVTEPAGNPIRTVKNHDYKRYASVHQNLSQLFSYEPLLGYGRNYRNRRFSSQHAKYVGEFTALKGSIADLSWTPNAIEFELEEPSGIWVNFNPSSYWRDKNNRQMFPEYRSFEVDELFILDLPAGKYQIKARPPLHELGLSIMLISVILGVVLYLWRQKKCSN